MFVVLSYLYFWLTEYVHLFNKSLLQPQKWKAFSLRFFLLFPHDLYNAILFIYFSLELSMKFVCRGSFE